jgi:hypothetical protein
MEIGQVLEDGFIVAAIINGQAIAVAPASKRAQKPFGFMDAPIASNPNVNDPFIPEAQSGQELTNAIIAEASELPDYQESAVAFAQEHDAFLPSLTELIEIQKNMDIVDAADTSGGELTFNIICNGYPMPELLEGQDPEDVVMPPMVASFVWTASNHSPKSQWFLAMESATTFASFRSMENTVIPVKYV